MATTKGVRKMKVRSLKTYREKKMKIQSVNPYTEQVVQEFELMTPRELDAQVERSREAFKGWRDTPIVERTWRIKTLGEHLRAEKRKYAELMTREMGKPIKESLAEVEKCAWLCDYYAENAFRFGIPAISAGNVVILKHASNVSATALSIEDAFKAAGFPESVFKTVLIDAKTALSLIDEDKVDAVSLTGSNKAGEQVGEAAGRKIKKVVLELGGSDPYIVLDDADVEKAARTAAKARMINAGQSCIAAKRFIVMDKVADEFKRHFTDQLKQLKIGDPMDETTEVGPLARKDILDSLKEQLRDAKAKGAEVFQTEHSFKKGLFFAPAVVYNPKENMKVLREEVFGPIAPVIVVTSEDEAVAAANNTDYGLGAAIWSRNTDRAERIATRIESGFITINDFVKSDPRLPFGGVKKSGVGRELSHYGLKEFVNIKTVVVRE